ncbi:MAG: hypothetical protein HXS48_00695 [Theionarchaea archaeon]|nr:hypothetical protein [Theionarchaea archaeon]
MGEYVYDGGGKRIQVTENSVTTTYIYSGLNVLYEENPTGTATYIYGPTGRLVKRTTISQETNTFYYHNDHLGSTRLVTDENKNIVSNVTYHPFGETYSEEGSENYLFNGKEKDSTGLYYYGARYYDSEIGRFITRDPISGRLNNPQSLNRYSYCLNNPVRYTDPFGLEEGDYKNKDRKDWTAEDWENYYNDQLAEGKDPEDIVNDLIEEEDYLGAVICTLFWIGFDASDITGIEYDSGLGSVHLNIQDTQVVIHVENSFYKDDSSNLTPGGMPNPPENEGDPVHIYIYAPAFTSANKLYNVVGHEMQHAKHYAKGGLFWGWYNYYKSRGESDDTARGIAYNISEMLAWQWNLTHFLDAPYDGGLKHAMGKWKGYSLVVADSFKVYGKP